MYYYCDWESFFSGGESILTMTEDGNGAGFFRRGELKVFPVMQLDVHSHELPIATTMDKFSMH
jgi:hypothetical protein